MNSLRFMEASPKLKETWIPYQLSALVACVAQKNVAAPPLLRPRERPRIERVFNKIKHCRHVATRYDKLAADYVAFVHPPLAAR